MEQRRFFLKTPWHLVAKGKPWLRAMAAWVAAILVAYGTYLAQLPTHMSGPFNFNLQHPVSVLFLLVGSTGMFALRPKSQRAKKAVSWAALVGLFCLLLRVDRDPPLELPGLLPSVLVNLLGWPYIPRCDWTCPAPLFTVALAFVCLLGIVVVNRRKP